MQTAYERLVRVGLQSVLCVGCCDVRTKLRVCGRVMTACRQMQTAYERLVSCCACVCGDLFDWEALHECPTHQLRSLRII